MNKKNVAVVMGGFSDEYIVSLKSGQLIFDELDRDLYNVYRVHVLKEGWFFVDDNDEKFPIDKADFSVKLADGTRDIRAVIFTKVH